MLYDAVDGAESRSPDDLRAAYDTQLRDVIETVGVEAAAAAADVEASVVRALADGDSPELTVEQAAAILSLDPDAPDAETIVFELRDHLLMGMTTGVLDVDTIASNVDLDHTGQEIQQALEGRIAMTLDELAAIHGFIAARNDR